MPAAASQDAARVLVGTCNWSDHTDFYPPEYDKADMKPQRIGYYARFFPMVEVDSTFYRLQPARNFQLWADRTPPGFAFNVKAYGEMTWHHRDDDGKAIEPRAETFAAFSEMVQPLRATGKLHALHFQFPPWFTYSREHLDYLGTVRELLPNDLLAVEFRHRSWVEGENLDSTSAALRDHDLAYTVVDQPQLGSGTVPPVVLVTSPRLAVFRFHGRNRQMWYARDLKSSRERFDYLYSEQEMAEWAPRVEGVAERLGTPGEVHVLLNNNNRNYAVVNAIDMQRLLGQEPAQGQPIPDGVRQTMNERATFQGV
jgi:uncharacterized protein YecE (DUF72 family)